MAILQLSDTHEEVLQLIHQGEGLQLDFKHEIDDSKKIARSLSAFANTSGGKLLIGVKDNGRIAGIRSDEEIHMLQAAAEMYCQPELGFQTKSWNFEGKIIIEALIPKSVEIPHFAPDVNGRLKAYVRVADQNFIAHTVQLEVWKKQKNKSIPATYSTSEKLVLDYLQQHQLISLKQFVKLCGFEYQQAKSVLADMLILDILELVYDLNRTGFRIKT